MRIISSPALSPSADLLGEHQGGTGVATLEDAQAVLKVVRRQDVNSPGSAYILPASGKIPAQVLALDALSRAVHLNHDLNVRVNQTVYFPITDFDSFKTYEILASAGSAALSDDSVVYVAPSSPGVYPLTINGTTFDVNVQPPGPKKPKIVSPADSSLDRSSQLTIYADEFVAEGGVFGHASSQWQLSTDAEFTQIIQTVSDTQDLRTQWTPGGLNTSTTYYARVRYVSTDAVSSMWSDSVRFTTKSTFLPTGEISKLMAYDLDIGRHYGVCLSISRNGLFLAVGDPLALNSQGIQKGAVYIYKKADFRFQLYAKITPGSETLGVYGAFGSSVDISDNGEKLVAGAPLFGTLGYGAAYIYVLSPSGYLLEQLLEPVLATNQQGFGTEVKITPRSEIVAIGSRLNRVDTYYYLQGTWNAHVQGAGLISSDLVRGGAQGFGNSLSMDLQGTRLAVGAPKTVNSNGGQGAVYVFRRVGSTWLQETRITGFDITSADSFGASVCFDDTASTLIVGAPSQTNLYQNFGGVYTYRRTDQTWNNGGKISQTPVAALEAQRFGTQVRINAKANVLMISAPGYKNTTMLDAGLVYMYTLTDQSNWSMVSSFSPSNGLAGHNFGVSMDTDVDASTLVVGAVLKRVPGNVTLDGPGEAYVFS